MWSLGMKKAFFEIKMIKNKISRAWVEPHVSNNIGKCNASTIECEKVLGHKSKKLTFYLIITFGSVIVQSTTQHPFCN